MLELSGATSSSAPVTSAIISFAYALMEWMMVWRLDLSHAPTSVLKSVMATGMCDLKA